jgi:xylulokinase
MPWSGLKMYLRKLNTKIIDMIENKFVLSFDVGTSGVKSILLDFDGNIITHAAEEYPSYMPHEGWMEQEPSDYWNAVSRATRKILSVSRIDPEKVAGIVFTTQAMGIIPVDKAGNVLRRNITWVDNRAEEEAKWLMNRFLGRKVFKSIIGVEITGKDVLPKLLWLRKKEPEIYNRTEKILDVNGYLKFRASGVKVSEWSGASSYTFDLRKKDWTRWLFRMIGFDLNKLPELVRSTDKVGNLSIQAAKELNLNEGIPVFGGCDDTQSAAIGSGSSGNSEAHIYLGTSAWVGVMTDKNVKFKNGAVCLQSASHDKNIVVGVTESAGSNIDWIIENFYSREKNDMTIRDVYALAGKDADAVPPGSENLMLTPWLFGERCPIGTTTTHGTMFNLGHHHTRAHILRAMSEGIAYNLRWIIENFEKDFGFSIPQLRIIGGGSQNESWMQIIADITNRKIETTTYPKLAGALGAGICALVGLGKMKSLQDVKKLVTPLRIYIPNIDNSVLYNRQFQSYKEIYKTNKNLYRRFNTRLF